LKKGVRNSKTKFQNQKENLSKFVFEIENLKFKKIFIFLKKSEIFEIFKLFALPIFF
jgi:hypothetical protein